jgi:hypothetical protein
MEPEKLIAYNYCIAFIDLLGQREQYKNEGLLRNFTSDQEKEAFNHKLYNTIGPIIRLQQRADDMMKGALPDKSRIPKVVPHEHHETFLETRRSNMKQQRWSDGLVLFQYLNDQDVRCPVNGIFSIFGTAGTLCFLGLTETQPVRGAIDIAWGMELHDSELYGAAVAKAYELESYVAQYPRIIVSDRTIEVLEAYHQNIENDIYSKCNKQFAEMCLNMIMQDNDGNFFIHYLGDSFREYISRDEHSDIYKEAINFVEAEYRKHRLNKDSKLAFRYSNLLSYFLAHPLKD